MKKNFAFSVFLFIFYTSSQLSIYAQGDYQVQAGIAPEEMVSIITGNLVETSNITFTGHTNSKGKFWGTSNLGMESGIIMASGAVQNSTGPNNSGSKSTDFNISGDPDLTLLSGSGNSNDASLLEFDFIPTQNTFSLKIVLGSEEYPEFANTNFSDVFGVFLSGPGISGPYSSPPGFPNGSKNIALIDTSKYISINNINNGQSNNGPCENCMYYVNNGTGTTPTLNPYIQYDGFTTVFEIGSVVIPNQLYHIKIAISDIADGSYDSGIFIATGSLITSENNHQVSETNIFMEGKTLKISGFKTLDKATVTIYSLIGTVLYHGIINGTEFTKSLENYPTGIYIVSCSIADYRFSTKIIR